MLEHSSSRPWCSLTRSTESGLGLGGPFSEYFLYHKCSKGFENDFVKDIYFVSKSRTLKYLNPTEDPKF